MDGDRYVADGERRDDDRYQREQSHHRADHDVDDELQSDENHNSGEYNDQAHARSALQSIHDAMVSAT